VLAYFGAMVGLVLGQFRLPLLIAALGSAPAAAASNLAISSLGAATGAVTHAREGRVEPRLLLTIGVPSTIAAYLSSSMVPQVEAWWIEALIGLTLLISAVPLARKARRLRDAADEPTQEGAAEPGGQAAPESSEGEGPVEPRSMRPGVIALEILVGTTLGALSGVVGLLLGTLRLPAMLRLGVRPAQAAGSNMMIGFFTGVAGVFGAVGGGRVSWLAFLTVGGATFLGALLGARKTKSLPSARHYALIAIVLVGVGVWLIASASLTR
jgi:uncharacterized membrane protein YfcA